MKLAEAADEAMRQGQGHTHGLEILWALNLPPIPSADTGQTIAEIAPTVNQTWLSDTDRNSEPLEFESWPLCGLLFLQDTADQSLRRFSASVLIGKELQP